MADFSWLNGLDDSQWDMQVAGDSQNLSRLFDLEDFLRRSDAVGMERWRDEFDVWGDTQPRCYTQMYCPPAQGRALVWITAKPGAR